MVRIVAAAVVLVVLAGCGGLHPGSEVEGVVTRDSDALGDVVPDAEEVFFEAGRPVDGDFLCEVHSLAAGDSVMVEISSRDFDAVAAAVDREGTLLAVCDDWGDETDSRLVLASVPRGSRLVVFALDGSSGEYEAGVSEASPDDFEDWEEATATGAGPLRGELDSDKDDDLLQDELEDELDPYVYSTAYGMARLHVFRTDGEMLVTASLASDDFDPILALVEVGTRHFSYVAHNDDYSGGLGARVDMVLEAGLYAAVVLPYDAAGDGRYTLTVESYPLEGMSSEVVRVEETGVDYAGTIVAGSGFAITRWPGISEEKPYDLLLTAASPCAFFEFDIPSGQAGLYEVDASSDDLDTYLCLLRGSVGDGLTYVAANDDTGGSDSRITSVLPAGTYLAMVSSYSGAEEGEVALSLQPATTQPLEVVFGRPADLDLSWSEPSRYLAFEAVAGRIYTVNVTSTDVDPYVEAVLADGTMLSDDDGGGFPDARLTLDPSPEQSGVVVLTVRDYANASVGRLRVEVTEERRGESEVFALYD